MLYYYFRNIASKCDITLGMVAMLLSKITEVDINESKYEHNYVNGA